MKKIYTILLCLITFYVSAQDEMPGILGAAISGGAMNYKGDLDESLTLKFTKPAIGVHFTLLPYTRFNFSLNYVHGSVWCDDAKGGWIPRRNLNFYSNIDEVSLQIIYRFQNKHKSFGGRLKWIPYLFTGVGYFHFNPKRKLDGVEYELQTIGTEGQYLDKQPNDEAPYPSPYKLWQINIPFGGGIKYKLTTQFDLGFEIGLRKLFTDYLDDVSGRYPNKAQMLLEEGPTALYLSDSSTSGKNSFSQRGYPKKNDWYTYTNICVTYYFTTKAYKAKQKFTTLAAL